jgi:hypothetical protein
MIRIVLSGDHQVLRAGPRVLPASRAIRPGFERHDRTIPRY